MASFSPVTQVDPSTLVVSAAAASAAEEKVTEDQFNNLHASSVTYRDLLIFEERLKLNMFRLKKRQQKYEGKKNIQGQALCTTPPWPLPHVANDMATE